MEATPLHAAERRAGLRDEVAACGDEVVGNAETGRARRELARHRGRNELRIEAVRAGDVAACGERARVDDGRSRMRTSRRGAAGPSAATSARAASAGRPLHALADLAHAG